MTKNMLLLLCCFVVVVVVGSWSNNLGQKRPKNTVFCAIFVRRPKTSLFTLFFSERVENTVFCDVFSTRGFKCTANTTVFFMFLLPVLKASQPKTVVFTVF